MNRWTIVLLTLSVLLLGRADLASASAEKDVRKIEWKNADKDGVVTVTAPADGRSINILKLEKPGIAESRYAIRGEVSYTDVNDTGFLEMWNYFDDGGFYFTRTLGDFGPMGALKGSSDWRPFVMPFNAGKGQVPNRLEVNVVLPKGGTVKIRDAKLVEYPAPATTKASAAWPTGAGRPAAWWGPRGGGLFGGIFGTIIGCCGAIIGTLAGRGRARGFVFALAITLIAIGAFLFTAGLFAVISRQPYSVWYPLLLSGGLSAGLMGGLLPTLKRRYEQAEIRKMQALDAMA